MYIFQTVILLCFLYEQSTLFRTPYHEKADHGDNWNCTRYKCVAHCGKLQLDQKEQVIFLVDKF